MNRSLLVLALFLSAAPAYSMTAAVTSTTAPAAVPSTVTSAATKSATTNAAPDTRPGAASAAPSKPALPDAVSVTRSAAVLSAPGVPMKSNPSKTSAILPSAGPQAGAVLPPPTNAAWTATADDSAGMHRGTLDAINPVAGTFSVFGQKLNFNAQQVKIFTRDGKAGSVFMLKRGASIRFTLDPADAQHRRVAVIYVD